MITPIDVVGFWRTAGPQKWFAKSAAFDQAIALRFEAAHHAAARGVHDDWAGTAQGALALLILLDQFPRNLFRDSGHAFATDGKALAVALHAIGEGFDQDVEPALRPFVYMPLMHSEDLGDQDRCIVLMQALEGAEDNLRFARVHRDIIARFGRFPHRNAALGRLTTPQEQEFLDEGGFAG
jgi:uncharacterized protein (DUF924 family)